MLKRLSLLPIIGLVLTAAALFAAPGSLTHASPEATITVDSTTYAGARDGVVTFREVILRTNADLSTATLDASRAVNVSDGLGASLGEVAAAPTGALPLNPGDLISAARVAFDDYRVLGITPSGQVTRLPLTNFIVPTGIAVDPARSRVVIASVSRIVIVNVETGAEQLIDGFDFIGDVAILPNGDLIAAEMGLDFLGQSLDGSVLRIDAVGNIQPIAPAFPWVNPGLVDIDPNGDVIVVNEGAGPEISPGSGLFFDTVESIDLNTGQVSTLYDGPGIIGTGLAVESVTTLLLASVFDLQRLDLSTSTLVDLCSNLFFDFADGIDVDADGTVVVNDIDFAGSSSFRRVNTQTCIGSLIATTEEAGGVAIVKGEADSDGDGIPDTSDNCPSWPNADQSVPPWPVPANDPDCDGFTTADENSIGTDPNLACGPNAWPPDHNSDGLISISDVLLMKASFGAKSPDDPIYDARRDLNPDGKISISDVLTMRPFFDQECTFG